MDRKKTGNQSEDTELEVYEAPRIVYREPLEAVATTCTGQFAKGDPGSCPAGINRS